MTDGSRTVQVSPGTPPSFAASGAASSSQSWQVLQDRSSPSFRRKKMEMQLLAENRVNGSFLT